MGDKVYLLDSNVFIESFNLYYAFEFESKFWDRLLEFIEEKRIVILDKVREECTKRQDGLKDWFNEIDRANDISSRTEAHVQGYKDEQA